MKDLSIDVVDTLRSRAPLLSRPKAVVVSSRSVRDREDGEVGDEGGSGKGCGMLLDFVTELPDHAPAPRWGGISPFCC